MSIINFETLLMLALLPKAKQKFRKHNSTFIIDATAGSITDFDLLFDAEDCILVTALQLT
jgi:hypothetical protein